MAEESCVELNKNSYIIQWLIIILFFFLPAEPNLVPNLKWRNNSVTPLFTLYKSQTPPYFLATVHSAHPPPPPPARGWFHCHPIHTILDDG